MTISIILSNPSVYYNTAILDNIKSYAGNDTSYFDIKTLYRLMSSGFGIKTHKTGIIRNYLNTLLLSYFKSFNHGYIMYCCIIQILHINKGVIYGGFIRDLSLKIAPKDIDILVSEVADIRNILHMFDTLIRYIFMTNYVIETLYMSSEEYADNASTIVSCCKLSIRFSNDEVYNIDLVIPNVSILKQNTLCEVDYLQSSLTLYSSYNSEDDNIKLNLGCLYTSVDRELKSYIDEYITISDKYTTLDVVKRNIMSYLYDVDIIILTVLKSLKKKELYNIVNSFISYYNINDTTYTKINRRHNKFIERGFYIKYL